MEKSPKLNSFGDFSGRAGGIRTRDLLTPSQQSHVVSPDAD